jgi:hypothetical protein
MPPFQKSELVDPWSAEANIGVPVRPFPRWMRCVKCADCSRPTTLDSLKSRSTGSGQRERVSSTRVAEARRGTNLPRTQMQFQRASCWHVATGTSTISHGTTSSTVETAHAKERFDFSRAVRRCRPRTCGSSATHAPHPEAWRRRSARRARRTFRLVEGGILTWTTSTTECDEEARAVLLGRDQQLVPDHPVGTGHSADQVIR